MRYFRATHRLVMMVVVAFTVYLSITGTMVQLIDLRSIFTHAPATDPNVIAMREAFDGPGSYAVIAIKDYTAQTLPQNADFNGMLLRTMESARLTSGNIPLRWVEFRMVDGKPVGSVESGGRFAQFDATTGQIIATGSSRRTDPDSPDSQRNTFKHLHRMTTFGNNALFVNVIVGLGLATLIFTGLVVYFKMLSGRTRAGRFNPFWVSGGWWLTLHRMISLVAAVFLTVVTLSGLWLAVESLSFGFYMGSARQRTANEQFAAEQQQRSPARQESPRLDPFSAEAQPKRLASMQHDIGLSGDEIARIKTISDAAIEKNEELHSSGGDPQKAREQVGALHQAEATSIMSILTDKQRPQFQAWRDAQLLGMPLPAGPPQGVGGPQQLGAKHGPAGPNGGDHGPAGPGGPGGGFGQTDPSSPLADAELPAMLQVTLSAEASAKPNTPIKVVRLRYFAGMPQGVIVTGGEETKQMVFNAKTGRAVSETEPGYPPTGFPFGWQAHEDAKRVHRGDIIGLPGRFMDLFAGLSMLYLSISGIVIYYNIWRRRRKAGKANLIWV